MKHKYVSLLLAGILIVSGVCGGNPMKVQAETCYGRSTVSHNVIAKTQTGYTDEELCKLAKDYYYKKHNQKAPIVEIDDTRGDLVTIHLYEIVNDGGGEGHTATYNWYYVSRKTGKGEDLFSNKIDLTEGTNTKTQPMLSRKNVKINGNVFKLTAKNYDDSEVIGVRDIIQYSKSTGKSISLVKKSSSESIVTNGKYLYYSKFEGDKGVIYKMDLETKKTSKVVSAKNYVLLGGTDKYLYIGKADFDPPAPMYKMQVYNMSTKQVKKSGIDYFVGGIQIEKNKILACSIHFDADNYRFDVMTESGKSIFKDNAVNAFIVKGKVFYNQIFYSGNEYTQEYYRYDINEKSKKKISYEIYRKYEKKYLSY
ncbi:MAG: hypothetical protein ACTTHM_02935 [Peptoanaerobacter stomatis]|uniref:hypothetical protein n=1 Tax=Peptoanaerobacter stomatis TaxID=796937 RepID=UPI003F9F9083